MLNVQDGVLLAKARKQLEPFVAKLDAVIVGEVI
jgi:hypothetical protein